VLVYQLSADGHSFSSLVASYTLDQLEGATPTGNGSHPGASVWNQLPILSVTDPGVHAVEQGGAITVPGSFSSSDDGGYYTGATIQITGGTFSSNENSSADDHLFVLDGLTQRTSGTFTATNITVSYDSAAEKLMLSGYDTIAHYNTVMSALSYYATGDNPTNYGNNTTRAVTWAVSDGSQNVPAGQGQNTSTTTITIDAVDDAPVNHLPPGNSGGNEDTTFAITGISISDADADPASQSMTVVLSVAHGALTLRTDVAGGIIAANVSGNGTGSVTLTGTQNAINAALADATGLQYLGSLNFNGADALTVTTSDNGHTGGDPGLTGGSADEQDQDQLAINVAPVNDAPTANATSASASEDPTTRIAITLSGSDVDGDTLSFTLASLPGHGQLFAAPAGGSALAVNAVIAASENSTTVYFQPTADYNGPDSFTYTAFDGTLDSAAATASVTITAVADVVDDNITVNENASGQSLALLANDTFENPGRAITAITQPLHSTTAINNNGTPGDLTDDFVVYTPAANYTGPDSFTYTVTSGGVSETGTVHVTVAAVNHTPTITSSPSFSVQENHMVVGTVTAVDPDNDAVTFALAGGSDQAFFAIDAHTGALSFLASPDFETPEDSDHDNVYDVAVSVTDTSNAGSTQLVHVSVTDVAEAGQIINGGNGNDTLNGTTGNDIISGGNGNDVINAGDGNDIVAGGNGNDVINGGRGNDVLDGGTGNDTLDGGSGNNTVSGGNGDDVLRAGNGNNVLDGGNGNDRLTVGTGNNTLSGGNGSDVFVFGPSFGQDTVTDFGPGDHIEFDGGVFANFSAVQAAMHQVGADTVISLGSGHAITLQHVNASSLHASDFLFA
jgi:Ca2+-binding RTX toxin-like protein